MICWRMAGSSGWRLAGTLFHSSSRLRTSENGGERTAILGADLLLAFVKLLSGKRCTNRLRRAFQEALQPADANGLVDPLGLEIGVVPRLDPKESAYLR